jgi:hypothetical protein
MEIAAERFVEADPEAVSGLLSDLGNHWLLADRSAELVSLEPRRGVGDGKTVRLRGPVGHHAAGADELLQAVKRLRAIYRYFVLRRVYRRNGLTPDTPNEIWNKARFTVRMHDAHR